MENNDDSECQLQRLPQCIRHYPLLFLDMLKSGEEVEKRGFWGNIKALLGKRKKLN